MVSPRTRQIFDESGDAWHAPFNEANLESWRWVGGFESG